MIIDFFNDNNKNLYLNNYSFECFENDIIFITNDNEKQNLKNYKNINTLYEIDENEFISYKNKINFVDQNIKFFITKFHISFFHFFMDTMSAIIDIKQNVNNPFFIIDCVSTIQENIGWESKQYSRTHEDRQFYINCIIQYFIDNDIKYFLLNENFSIKINNCYFINNVEKSNKVFNEINNVINNYQSDKTKIPFKKIYLSKRVSDYIEPTNYTLNDFTNKEIIELRIINERIFEKYLKNKGFEIIDSEKRFKSMEEQIDYFSEVKTLCSVTQAGLVNSLFMKEGGNIIEFISPMIADINSFKKYTIHSYEYMNIAYSQNHNYIGVKNLFDANLLINYIENNEMLLKILNN